MEPTATDPVPSESTATNHTVRDHSADDATPESDGEREAADADNEMEAADADRVAALERRVTELEAELEAVHGLLDGVEAVDETVERRASAALAKAEALEERFAPEEPGLVRERLPDMEDSVREEGAERNRTGQYRGDGKEAGSDPEREPRGPNSRIGDRGVRGAERRTGSADAPEIGGRTSTQTVGNARTCSADAGTPDERLEGTGAISSVGPSTLDAGTAADGSDRSLAARLRDAFR